MIKTKVISAFPAVGKTHFFKTSKLNVLDSDSSKFDKSKFPQNYISHIKKNIGKVDVILVSSHDVVREVLVEDGIEFTLIYPDVKLKDEFIERYKERGSPESFISLVGENWSNWIEQLENQKGCKKVKLKSGQYLSDVI